MVRIRISSGNLMIQIRTGKILNDSLKKIYIVILYYAIDRLKTQPTPVNLERAQSFKEAFQTRVQKRNIHNSVNNSEKPIHSMTHLK